MFTGSVVGNYAYDVLSWFFLEMEKFVSAVEYSNIGGVDRYLIYHGHLRRSWRGVRDVN